MNSMQFARMFLVMYVDSPQACSKFIHPEAEAYD